MFGIRSAYFILFLLSTVCSAATTRKNNATDMSTSNTATTTTEAIEQIKSTTVALSDKDDTPLTATGGQRMHLKRSEYRSRDLLPYEWLFVQLNDYLVCAYEKRNDCGDKIASTRLSEFAKQYADWDKKRHAAPDERIISHIDINNLNGPPPMSEPHADFHSFNPHPHSSGEDVHYDEQRRHHHPTKPFEPPHGFKNFDPRHDFRPDVLAGHHPRKHHDNRRGHLGHKPRKYPQTFREGIPQLPVNVDKEMNNVLLHMVPKGGEPWIHAHWIENDVVIGRIKPKTAFGRRKFPHD